MPGLRTWHGKLCLYGLCHTGWDRPGWSMPHSLNCIRPETRRGAPGVGVGRQLLVCLEGQILEGSLFYSKISIVGAELQRQNSHAFLR